MTESARADRPLVGREDELARLDKFVAGSGPARALVLEGEPGIGKTALWNAGLEAARARSLRVLACSPGSSEARLSFAGLSDLLAGTDAETLPALPAPQRTALRVALLLEEPGRRPPSTRAIATALLNALRELAARGGVLVAIDDVQWLDGPSLEAVRFAFRRLREEPVRFLLAQRVEHGTHEHLELPDASRLAVGPLSLAALFELVRLHLGLKLPRPTLVRLHEASAGNPFFALEIARALAERRIEHAPDQPLPLPDDLRDLVRARLEGLPAPTLGALRVAAALSEATADLLAAAGEDPAELEPARQAGVVELGGDRIRFTHPLLASVCLAELPAPERRELHRRLARVARGFEERARHAALAADGPSEELAEALDAAARQASTRGAPGRAAELAELASVSSPAGDPQTRRRLAAAEHHLASGNVDAARALAEPLAEELPPGPEHARALLLLARTAEDDMERARRLAERALEEAGGEEPLRAEIHDALAVTWIFSDVGKAVGHARARVELVERAGDPFLLVDALGELAFWEAYTGEVTPGVLERAQELASELEPAAAIVPLRAAGVRLLLAARFEEARPLLERVHALTLERGEELDLPSTLGHLRLVEVRAGNFDRAERYAVEGLQVAEQLGLRQTEGAALQGAALVAAHLGREREARAAVAEGLPLSEEANDVWFASRHRAVLGFLELSLGRADAALEQLRELPDRFAGMGYRHPGMSEGLVDAIHAHVAVGELERARDLTASLERDSNRFELPWARAAALRCRGLLAAADDELEAATGLFEQALSEHERRPIPLEVGRTLLALGEARRRLRQKRAARECLERAASTFEELRAALWLSRAREELGRIGGRTAPRAGLTATERQIVELVSEGRTNRQTAELMHLSPKTVAWNLSKIYRKLGVRSRTELAARRR